MMPHYRIRNVETTPSGNTRAEAQFGVVAIREEIFIEAADLVQHLFPIHGGAAIRPQYFFGAIIAAIVRLASTTPAVLAVRINQVPGFVDAARVVVHHDLGRRHSNLRTGGESSPQRA